YVPDLGQQIIRTAITLLVLDPLQIAVAVAQHFLDRKLKTAGFLFEQLASDLDRLSALLIGDPVPHAIARARSDYKVQPVTRWMRIRAADDFDHVPVLNHRAQRNHAPVDPRTRAGVPDFRVNHVSKIYWSRAAGQLNDSPHRCERINILGIKI